MKQILISIKPEWVAKILSGEKTVEIRKTAPKELPCEVYIYCTKSDKKGWCMVGKGDNKSYFQAFDRYALCNVNRHYVANGKVVAKFTLRKIIYYECSVYIPEKGVILPPKVNLRSESDYGSGVANRQKWGWEEPKLKEILEKSCLTENELAKYLSNKSTIFSGFGAWHISDLEIFDKPKELSEFGLERVPQSGCYVEERQ